MSGYTEFKTVSNSFYGILSEFLLDFRLETPMALEFIWNSSEFRCRLLLRQEKLKHTKESAKYQRLVSNFTAIYMWCVSYVGILSEKKTAVEFRSQNQSALPKII